MEPELRDGGLSPLKGYGRLKGRVALVMGAGSIGPGWGNGKAAAVAYAREGASVVCADRDLSAAVATAEVIRSEGGNSLAVQCDVIDEAAIRACVQETVARFATVGILHNNVGIFQAGGVLGESAEEFSRVMDINVRGAFLAMRYVLPLMGQQRTGVITNVASVAAIRMATTHYSSYYASKAGLCHLSRSVAAEYAPMQVRVNCVLPGFMDTPMVNTASAMVNAYGGGDPDAMRRARDALVPMGYMGTAWDVAWASVFLASDEARYITGINLPVDGGVSGA